MKPEIINDLQNYLNEHIKMQLILYNLSSNADRLQFPGFAKYFQIQARDEVAHQGRIMNFLMDRDISYQVETFNIEVKEFSTIKDIMLEYQHHRQYFSDLTNQLAANAQKEQDLVTNKFYDWFIIDFYEELAEIKDIIDWIDICNNDYYVLDKKMAKKSEPDIATVIQPFSPHD